MFPADSSNEEYTLQGIAASPGVAHGKALLYLQQELEIPAYSVEESNVEEELSRFEGAIIETRKQINAIRDQIARSLGEAEAQIFDAHLLVLEDRALLEEVIHTLRTERKNIEYCYHKTADRYIEFFNSMEDAYLKERVADIRDVSRRLLRNLLGLRRADLSTLSENRVLVAEELTPSDTAELDRNQLLAIATDGGSRTSHAVIMARAIRIPAVVGLREATRSVPEDAEILVDGYDGLVIVHPSKSTLFRYGKIATARKRLDKVFLATLEEPSATKDGVAIRLELNVEGHKDLEPINPLHYDGVGLLRTENLFLKQHNYPSEEIQFNEYRAVVTGMLGKPVIIRTLDLGGDKQLCNEANKEDNPFMGYRAIRFCLDHPLIFQAQLRAILRASAFGPVKIMFPMISGVEELRRAKAAVEEAKASLRAEQLGFDETIQLGCMIEIPSAATIADLLAREAAFFSIGSNDLIQYLLAVDRVNERVAHLHDPAHPAVMRTLVKIIQCGNAAGIPVSICGEMAGDPLFASFLIGCGATHLSMSPGVLPEVKFFLRSFTLKDARDLAQAVLLADDSVAVMQLLQSFHHKHVGKVLAKVAEEPDK
jgi:phosphotransferase system enzyme I (PtsI)